MSKMLAMDITNINELIKCIHVNNLLHSFECRAAGPIRSIVVFITPISLPKVRISYYRGGATKTKKWPFYSPQRPNPRLTRGSKVLVGVNMDR